MCGPNCTGSSAAPSRSPGDAIHAVVPVICSLSSRMYIQVSDFMQTSSILFLERECFVIHSYSMPFVNGILMFIGTIYSVSGFLNGSLIDIKH